LSLHLQPILAEFLSEYYWKKRAENDQDIAELHKHMSNICSEYTNAVIKVYLHMRDVL